MMRSSADILGRTVEVVVDRPLGSCHPHYTTMLYPVNYGYVPGIPGGDGEAQDAYILGIAVPLRRYVGRVVAVIHRLDDREDKWVVAPQGMTFTVEEIREQTDFQERFFRVEIEAGG